MHDRELYRQIFGIQAPWEVSEVEIDLPGIGVTVHIRHFGSDLACPQCGAACSGYDTREREWRHLDTCQCKSWLVAQAPVCDGDQQRRSGAARHRRSQGRDLGYLVRRAARRGAVWLANLGHGQWGPFIDSMLAHVPGAAHKIAFDKVHVAMHLGAAVDKVRRTGHKALLAEGEWVLIKSRYLCLQHPDNMTDKSWVGLKALKSANLKTARAWAIKTHAMCLWDYQVRGWARRAWMDWHSWAIHSRLEPVKKVARTIKAHLEGILTAVFTGATNARAEGFNAMIQKIKRDARGFRSKERFKATIYFHLGGLDLYPEAVRG